MNKIAIYTLLILIFLGASRSFLPKDLAQQYIYDRSNYPSFFEGRPITVILVDAYRVGFVIKSNIHRYRIINVFEGIKEIEVRVSKKYFEESLSFIGLSIFRRNEQEQESVLPVPPGSLLIADPAYGRWANIKTGDRVWRFYRAYRYLRPIFMWGNFRPNIEFYKQLKLHIKEDIPFHGKNAEFGAEGKITKKHLKMEWYHSRDKKFSFKEYMNTLTKIPMLRNK